MILYKQNLAYWPRFDTEPTGLSYLSKEEEGDLVVEVEIPGYTKEYVTIGYKSDIRELTIKVNKDHVIEQKIYILPDINEDKFKATLELGILKITAPIKNADITIQID